MHCTRSLAVMTIAVLPSSVPFANTKEVDTYLNIAVSPNPVGVGQTAYVFAWLSVYPPTAAGAGGDRWRELSITMWKPDGTTETQDHLTSDPVGGVYVIYTPTQEGKCSFQELIQSRFLCLIFYLYDTAKLKSFDIECRYRYDLQDVKYYLFLTSAYSF